MTRLHTAAHRLVPARPRTVALVALAAALVVPAAADAAHRPPERTLASVTIGGHTFTRAEALRRHLLLRGRSWERFLDHRPAVVRAYHLRPVRWRRATFYSRAGLARRLRMGGLSYVRWAHSHPRAATRLQKNTRAKLGGKPVRPAPPPAPAPAPPPAPAPAPPPAPAPAPPPEPAPAPAPAPPPEPAPAPPPPPPATFGARMGISLDNPEYRELSVRDRELDETAATGARWVRFDVKWSDVQWSGESSFNWSKYDPLVDAARARGLDVLANLAYSPTWARPAGTTDKHAPDTTARREAYARFVGAAVSRYRGRVTAWEIWNEPNNTMFWQPAPDAASYAALLRHAYAAAKASDPAATVVAGATSPASTANGMIDEVQFLQGVYAAGGRGHFDAWSHHPYDFNLVPGSAHPDSAWWQTYGSSPSIRSVLEANGDGAKKVWATEYGVPSSGYGSLTEATQADRLRQAYTLWRGFAWAGPIFNYMVRDGASPGNAAYWSYLGVTRADWSRKPAFAVMQQAAAS